MELKIAGSANVVNVSDTAFGKEFNEPLIHQVVTAFLSGARQGTRAQKTRAEVSGGGRKPWRQKGSGRARAGSTRSPIWRTGGKTFAAVPQDHSQKVNKKMYRAALSSIFSEIVRQDRLVIVESIAVDSPKTKQFTEKLKSLGVSDALIVADAVEQNLYLASRNIPYVDVRDVVAIDPVSLIAHEKVVVTVPALKKIEEMLG